MTPRLAEVSDAEAIAAIWNHYIRETLATFTTAEKASDDVAALIAARADAGHATFIAASGRAVAGFASYSQFRAGPGYARTLEHTVLLAPEACGKGHGRALLTAVLDHARAGGGHSDFAGISSGNPGALAFHARMGFREAALLREAGWKSGKWWDLHLLRIWL